MQHMITDKTVSTASYAGGGFSILSALTLTEWGIVVGIVTAILTFALNAWWGFQRNKREQEIHDAALRGAIDRRQRGSINRNLLSAVAALSITAGGAAFVMLQEGTGPTERTTSGETVAKAYADPAHGWKVPTICAGRTKGVFQGQTATLDECDAWLIEDLTYAGAAIKRCTPVKMTQWQYNYLASFVHNVGPTAFCTSLVATRINVVDCLGAVKQMHASPQFDQIRNGPRIWRGKPIIDRKTGEVLLATGAPIMKWTTAAGIPLPGLIKRRNSEAAGFAADCDLWINKEES